MGRSDLLGHIEDFFYILDITGKKGEEDMKQRIAGMCVRLL